MPFKGIERPLRGLESRGRATKMPSRCAGKASKSKKERDDMRCKRKETKRMRPAQVRPT